MESNKYLWEIVDDIGNSLAGYKTEQEARNDLPLMKADKEWHIRSYKAEAFE